jgi:peptide chain release factor 2
MSAPGFWDRPDDAREIMAEVSRLKGWTEPWQRLNAKGEELVELAEFLRLEGDAELEQDWIEEQAIWVRDLEALELKTMLQGESDHMDAILTIQSGAGGTESQDWAEMLLRMYQRWGERHDYQVELLDMHEGEEAGIKSASIQLRGSSAFGYLKAEKGVHRLVRISPFDSQARRHTSFASVFVYPLVEDDDVEIEIADGDLRVDTFRASGAGGQHVNKTDSAIRLTHLPTGIVVSCQKERSQHKNRATAMKMLKAALYEREMEAREQERLAIESTKSDIGWGSQIRSYVFQPYTMVNDHRTDLKLSDVHKVMDGDLDPFIEAYLKKFGAQTTA